MGGSPSFVSASTDAGTVIRLVKGLSVAYNMGSG